MDRAKKFSTILGIVIVIVLLPWIFNIGITKNEQNECRRWAEMAKERPDFYLTDWQQEQCDHYDIEVMPKKVINKPELETGLASWYNYDLDEYDQICRKENEPCYSQLNLTGASRKYDRGTKLKVSYQDKSVIVRVNDYGPADESRIIDLSSYAFSKLAPLSWGLITVTIEEIK